MTVTRVTAPVVPEVAPIDVPMDTNAGQAIHALYQKVNEIARVLAEDLGYSDVEITFPVKPNEEVEFHHGLGRYPTGYWLVRKDRACDVYDSSAGSWNKTTMRLMCNVADATVTVRVY